MNMVTASNAPYGLGRLPQPDVRNFGFLAIEMVDANAPIRTRYWTMRAALDQGKTPQCVDYSLNTCLMGAPKMLKFPAAPLGTIYKAAQDLDIWPGNNYDGTSVLAGEKAGVQLGLFREYRWMRTVDDILKLLSNVGPVVIGSNWYEGMFTPDSRGEVHIGGSVAGGHAYCLCGLDTLSRKVRQLNTWGTSWGQNGRSWISYDTLDKLFSDGGEAALPVQQPIS